MLITAPKKESANVSNEAYAVEAHQILQRHKLKQRHGDPKRRSKATGAEASGCDILHLGGAVAVRSAVLVG